MKILSIDIGSKNCAFYIEEFDSSRLTSQSLYKEGKRVYWKLVDFSKGDIYVNIIAYLDKNLCIFDSCNGIIIEKQFKLNYKAQVIQHFIFAYFKNVYGPFKYISDISATKKTQILNAPKKMDKPTRKKWATVEMHKICDIRNDTEGLKILYATKSDDLADACLQLKAFQKLVFVKK